MSANALSMSWEFSEGLSHVTPSCLRRKEKTLNKGGDSHA
jgi:hypothetical protein